MKTIDEVGNQYGRLTVIERAVSPPQVKSTDAHWKVLCSCGNYKSVSGVSLRSGNTRSCGCLARDHGLVVNRKHGGYMGRLYKIWQSMRDRCRNPNSEAYKNYGGRGVVVCSQWSEYMQFELDVGGDPGIDYELDRIDNNKGYEPGNVRWATKTTNNRNRRNNHLVEWEGRKVCLSEASELSGIPAQRIRHRHLAGVPKEKMYQKEYLR